MARGMSDNFPRYFLYSAGLKVEIFHFGLCYSLVVLECGGDEFWVCGVESIICDTVFGFG